MILKAPVDQKNFASNLLFTNSARNAWKHILEHFNIESPGKILLPSYIGYTDREGSGVFDPVMHVKTPYEFYPLSKDLSIQPGYLAERLKRGDIKLLLVIHYFGFCPNDMDSILQLCRENNVILVEDCAHAYTLGNNGKYIPGNRGDFTFYSLHKFFAVSTGGVLKINSGKYQLPAIPANERCDRDVLEHLVRVDVPQIIERRRANYKYLAGLLSGIDAIEIMYELPDNTIPQSFPVLVKKINRPDLYFLLEKKGIQTIALYYRLIDQLDRKEFPVSFEVSDSILNFPVHQDTTFEDLDLLVKELRTSILELTA